MITNAERSQIKQLLNSPQWQTIQRVADLLCEQIGDERTSKQTQWESIKTLLKKEGEIEGIKRFLQELFTQASQ